MKLNRALAVLASAAASTLAAGAMLASPASAVPHAPTIATFTGLTLSTSPIFYGSEGIEVATFTVANLSGPPPAGTVTVFAGSKAVCAGNLTPFVASLTTSFGSCTFGGGALFPGNYQVVASYPGDQQGNFASSSPAKSLTVSPGVTSSDLTLSAPDATFGGEHLEGLFITVNHAAGGAAPSGGFSVTDEIGDTMCVGMLTDTGTGACTLNDTTEFPGNHTLTANYNGDSNYTDSSSTGKQFFVLTAGTTTMMTLPATTLAYDEEGGLLVNYQVTSSAAGSVPTGSVVVNATGRQPICTGTLSNGIGNCEIPDQALLPGTYQVVASYNGDVDNSVSDSAAQSLTITQEPTRTAVALSTAKATFGREQAERISVRVRPRTSGTPTGQVTIKSGSTVVCAATLMDGKATCSPRATTLRPGADRLTASYAGDSTFAASSGHATLTVAAEPATTLLALSAAVVRSGHEQAERLTVAVKPAFGGTPAGLVTVKAGSVTICTINLKNGKGACNLSASRLHPGSYRLVARYGGRSPFAASVSAGKTLTVTQ
jgi:hypothetical protein